MSLEPTEDQIRDMLAWLDSGGGVVLEQPIWTEHGEFVFRVYRQVQEEGEEGIWNPGEAPLGGRRWRWVGTSAHKIVGYGRWRGAEPRRT